MRQNLSEWLTSRQGRRFTMIAVLILDIVVTVGVGSLVGYGRYSIRIVFGVFILFPVVLLFGIGTPMAVVSAIRDHRKEMRHE